VTRAFGYAPLLANRQVRRLLIASMVARLPSAMLPLAVLLLVVESSGSIAAAGLCSGAYGIGRAVLSPFVGALVDRLGQARVLIAGAVAQTAALMALIAVANLHAPLIAVGAMAFIGGATSPPVQACLRALWPMVAAEGQIDTAYSFDATTQELIWIAGPLLVAAILGAGSAALAVAAAAVLACAGITLFVTTPVSRQAHGARGARWLTPRALGDGRLRALVGTSVLTGFAWGAMTFGLSALAVISGSPRSSGVLLAALSAGSIAGGLLYGARRWPGGATGRFRILLGANAVVSAPLMLVRTVLAATPLAVVAGLTLAPIYATSYALTGRFAPAGATTESFTWTSSAFALGVALGTGVAGVTTESTAPWSAFALACAAPVAAAALTLLLPAGLRPANDGRGDVTGPQQLRASAPAAPAAMPPGSGGPGR
jgi:MFS family permease